jgi:hypothetical protein
MKTLAHDLKITFDTHFSEYVHSRAAYTPHSSSKLPFILAQDMLKYKQDSPFTFAKDRKKSIILDDSMMRYTGFFEKKSHFLTPRNPLVKDDTIIDYEMDSEEEWNE